ncbi:NUC189-domain-containing protein [Infundibulicybe gibba]|nr:NUC189-domain-containing protein [Infundibulicybe gibba]
MAPSDKSKKTKTKPPKSRPAATSALSQPVVDDSSNTSVLSAFSPNGNLFAFLSLAVDKHRLRVYDTLTGQSTAELTIDSARVSSLSWSNFDPSDGSKSGSKEGAASPNKKRRKKRDSVGAPEEDPRPTIEVVVLGLSDGSIMFFSPTHGRVLRTLTHSSSTAAIECVAVAHTQGDGTIWTSSADGTVHLWNTRTNEIIGSWKNDDRIPYSSMAIRPAHQGDRLDILAAHHSIRLLSTQSSASDIDKKKPKQLAAFTGHASRIKHLEWDSSTRFLSLAEADRFIYIWEVPEGSATEGTSVASIPLESDARAFSLSGSSDSQKQTLLALSASGRTSIFPIPAELVPPASSNRTQHKIATLIPRSNITVSTDENSSPSRIISVAFARGQVGHVHVARIMGGIRPVFDVVQYLDDSGEFIKSITLEDISDDAMDVTNGAPNKRYAEPTSIAVGPGLDEDMDDLVTRDIDGDLDVDLAELSLGQRLTALSGADARPASDSDDEAAPKANRSKNKKSQETAPVVPANSLTRTLIQALHSSDSRLLETCLAHSDQALIRNTIRRLPPQLAVPLINACVERLGRGARAGNMKGGGGGASAQRGTGLVTWVKTVLIVHSGHLMTIPDLVARLAGLHSTLTARLALQESLLTLNGRLDMVLSQIEMRSSTAPAPLAQRKGKNAPKAQEREVVHYVEGESEEDEDDPMGVEVEIESGDDAGSVEDVELGGSSEDDDDDSDGEDGSEESNDSDGEPTMNGFIDDEAEEYSDEDEEESE